ncbi:MAG: hypothetical protein GWO24_38560, partial [Akkermansiaceae bacterium]|nr:hypothetical protein [Akkermansiaceae bacterium]
AGLAKSFRVTGDDHGKRATETVAHSHELPSGILSLIAELYGETVLKGEPEEEDNWIFEALVGASYSLLPGCDIRAGYAFPISNDSEL